MAKGYQGNKDRLETTKFFGKAIGKRAGFKCEWCESKENLRVWDYKPDAAPNMERWRFSVSSAGIGQTVGKQRRMNCVRYATPCGVTSHR